jgi:hypothetical protein
MARAPRRALVLRGVLGDLRRRRPRQPHDGCVKTPSPRVDRPTNGGVPVPSASAARALVTQRPVGTEWPVGAQRPVRAEWPVGAERNARAARHMPAVRHARAVGTKRPVRAEWTVGAERPVRAERSAGAGRVDCGGRAPRGRGRGRWRAWRIRRGRRNGRSGSHESRGWSRRLADPGRLRRLGWGAVVHPVGSRDAHERAGAGRDQDGGRRSGEAIGSEHDRRESAARGEPVEVFVRLV